MVSSFRTPPPNLVLNKMVFAVATGNKKKELIIWAKQQVYISTTSAASRSSFHFLIGGTPPKPIGPKKTTPFVEQISSIPRLISY
jgi:hypothetical protein